MSEEVEEVASEEVVAGVEAPVEEVAEAPVEEVKTEKAFVDNMLESMTDEDVKGHKLWDNLKGKNADELGRYVKELKSFAGKKGDIPKPEASEDEWGEFYSKLGRPDSSDDYNLEISNELREVVGDESAKYYEESIANFSKVAFDNGLNSSQAEAIINAQLIQAEEQATLAKKLSDDAAEKNETELRSEWGAEYDGMYDGVKALLKTNGVSDEGIAALDKYGVIKEPELAIALGRIAAQFEDDPEIGHHQTRTVSGLHDQLNDVNSEVGGFIERGESVPKHIAQKRMDIMNKLGDNL